MSVLDERLARVLEARKEMKREYLKKYREEHREAIRIYENGYRKRRVEQAMHEKWEAERSRDVEG